MTRKDRNKHRQEQAPKQQSQIVEQSSESSSEDEDAILLTPKVQYKLLSTVAKLKALRQNKKLKEEVLAMQQPIFEGIELINQDSDFSDDEYVQNIITNKKKGNSVNEKYTYKKMLQENNSQQEQDEDVELPPAVQEKMAKQKFKQAINRASNGNEQQDSLFKIKKSKLKEQNQQLDDKQKFNSFLSQITKNNSDKKQKKDIKLVQKVWGDNQGLDQTDLFLKKYILDKKWLSKNLEKDYANNKKEQNMIDQQDEQRSVQMDQYEAEYNFRYQQPDGNKINFYPRGIPESIRIKPQTRKQQRKALIQRKKEQQKKLREQADKRRAELKQNIIDKLAQNRNTQQKMDEEQPEHDWFFCDDCGKGLLQKQTYFVCNSCDEYILCTDCFQIIIHSHQMEKAKVQKGFGAPDPKICQKMVSQLKTCTKCRIKIKSSKNRYEYTDRNYMNNILCEKCYDSGNLQVKKKYKLVQGQIDLQNPDQVQQLLENNPQKIKQLTSQQQIEKLVDQYLQNEFQDVLADGTKAKFKYISVKPQSYGLSDQQILFGDDKQLNKYVSIKNLAPYRDQQMRLRSSIYNQKIKSIKKTMKQNKKLLKLPENVLNSKIRRHGLNRMKRSSQAMKQKREKYQKRKDTVRLTNLSDPQIQKKKFIPSSRLASYGITQ